MKLVPLKKEQIIDKSYFETNKFLQSLINEISSKTSLNLKDRIENIKSFPIFISDKFQKPKKSKKFQIEGDQLHFETFESWRTCLGNRQNEVSQLQFQNFIKKTGYEH